MKDSIAVDRADPRDEDDFIIETVADSSETNSIKTGTSTLAESNENIHSLTPLPRQSHLRSTPVLRRASTSSINFNSTSKSPCALPLPIDQSTKSPYHTNNLLISTISHQANLSDSMSSLPYSYQGKYTNTGVNTNYGGNYGRKASIVISNLRRSSVQVVISVWTSFRGIFFAFLSAVFFSITSAIVKHLSEIHPGIMSCFRFIGILLFSLPMVSEVGFRNILGPRELRFWVLLRGIAGATSVYLRYCALQYLPIANATIIVLSMPVFVCILARVFLKEPCGIFHVIALAVTLLGIAFTAKLNVIFGSSEEEAADAGIDKTAHLLGLAAGMGATLVGSSSYVIVRKVKCLDQSIILFNFAWVAIIESSIITYFQDGIQLPTTVIGTWLLVILTVASFYAQFLLTKALKCEEAGLVSVTRASSEVIFAFLTQIFIFQSMPDWYSYVGAFLVTTAVSLTSIRKYIVTLPKDSIWRRLFAFTLK
ncbi:solute carrier family 35 member G1-like [Tetranychus urticae]|uniref:EamA domain-containing protein n=1 Tax=Tetranychus urticae TaxID=32264 RepID=T1KRQ3_TETUR|nr:solute carrier family 35 member G1-like [Tetranychus urticae]